MSGGLDFDLSEVKMSFRKRQISKVDDEERISVADSFVSFLSSALGAGVLSIPLSFAYSGLVQATVILALVSFMNYHSNCALLKVTQKVNGKSYADVAEKSLGKSKSAVAIVFLFFLNLLAASVSYLIAIHWALSSTINYLSVNFHFDVPAFLGWVISCQRLDFLGSCY
jgi:amino acid permease